MSTYRPWAINTVFATILTCLAAGLLVMGLLKGIPAAPLVVATAFLLYLAWSQWQRGKSRRFGKSFEAIHIRHAMQVLPQIPSFRVQANVQPNGREDIDLVVETHGRRFPIEIKSYRRWTTYLFGWHFGRERRAIKQSKRQARALGSAHGIIWLPQGRRGFWQHFSRIPKVSGNVFLVFGDAQALRETLQQL